MKRQERLRIERLRLVGQFQLAAIRLRTAERLRAMGKDDAPSAERLVATAQALEALVGEMPTMGRA